MSTLLSKKRIRLLKKYGWTREAIGDALDVMDEIPWADFSCVDGVLWCGDGDMEITFYPDGQCVVERGRAKRTVQTISAAREVQTWNGI